MKSKREAYKLGVVWEYENHGSNLDGAYDSLVDAHAQLNILTPSSFVPFIDCTLSILPIDEMFSRTLKNEWKRELEPIPPVHAPWVELTKEHNIKWEPIWEDKNTGPWGGPHAGLTQFIVEIVCSAKGLANIIGHYYLCHSSIGIL
jgi:hypothetical protein